MDKLFKHLLVLLSSILIVATSVLVFVIPPYIKSDKTVNFFEADAITQNIKNMELNMTSIIYVKDEKGEWQEYQRLHGDENRIWVDIDDIPKNLKNAFIAIEDERFYTHDGVDWKRTLSAVGNMVFKFNDTEFGGSTITQQLIKNITKDNGKNADRKVREIVRAILVEQRLDKDEILEAYLNTIALGNGYNGVQAAANNYFNKDVKDLTLLECACLAAITKHPEKLEPIEGMKENKERRNAVLDKMLELGMIEKKEYDEVYDLNLVLDMSQENTFEPDINNYFVDALIEQVIIDFADKYNCDENIASTMLYNGGYKIYATMDSKIQATMENVYSNTEKYFNLLGKDNDGYDVTVQSAMTIIDYSGHIVGIVGGAGEKTVNRGLNRATSSPRQPGSTMKPIGVYALAIEKDIVNYSSVVRDEPINNYYPDGKKGPKEWYGYYKGPITLDYAIRKSANTIPVKLLKDIGIETSYDFLKNKLNCNHLTEADKNLSALALGGCNYGMTTTESAAAYAIFGNLGVYHEPTTYYKIESYDGETVIDYDEKGEQVISQETATIMNHLLQGVVYGREGTGAGIASFDRSMRAFAKTGTSSESNDLWMVAGSPYYVGSVWYGFDKQQEVKSTSAAATVWKDVMKEIHKDLEPKTFVDSENVYKKGSGYYKKDANTDNLLYGSGSASNNTSSDSSTTSSTNTTSSNTTSSSTSSDTSSSDVSSSTSSDATTPQEPPTDSDKENDPTPQPPGDTNTDTPTPTPPEEPTLPPDTEQE